MRLLPYVFLLTLSAGSLQAQLVTVGVKGGVPLTGDLDSVAATSESKPYVVGPMITVGLPAGFRIEVDALYRRVAYRTSGADILGGSFTERDTGNSWEFPILARKSLFKLLYVGAGIAPRTVHGTAHANVITVISPFGQRVFAEQTYPASWDDTVGIVAAAGIEKRFGHMRIAPEIRYTYWTKPSLDISGSHGFLVRSEQHQADFLLGITF